MYKILLDSSLTVFINNTSYQVNKQHPYYVQLREAAKNDNEADFLKYYSERNTVKAAVERTNNENVTYENGQVYYKGQPVHGALTNRVQRYAAEGLDFAPLLKFLDNLMQNPSSSSVNEGFDFLQHKALPITEDGCFIAYKAVRENYLDKHSGTVSNHIGAIVEMERNKVDDDRRNECSYGYHVGALDYSGPGGSFYNSGDKCIIVKINPRDIVAVPKDYNCQKMRVCRYEVIGDYVAPLNAALYTASGDKVSTPAYNNTVYFEAYEVEVGDNISFEYNKNGEVTQRDNWDVCEIEDDFFRCYNDSIGYRTFHTDGMDNIVINSQSEEDEEYIDDGDHSNGW